MALDPTVVEFALERGGLARRSDILALGKSASWIDRELRSGRLAAVKPGVYRVVHMTDYDNVLRAALVALPGAVVSHESAAKLLDFPVTPPFIPTVTVPANTTHKYPDVIVHRNGDLIPEHITTVNGLATTHDWRTLVDLAANLSDRAFDRLVENLSIAGRLHLETFASFARALCKRGKPGSTRIQLALDNRLSSAAPSSTRLERLGLSVLADQGLPDPQREYPAPWNEQERIDAAYPPQRLGIEWDSKSWHSAVDRMDNDRRRDREAAMLGWVVLRYTWNDLTNRPDEVGREVHTLLVARSA